MSEFPSLFRSGGQHPPPRYLAGDWFAKLRCGWPASQAPQGPTLFLGVVASGAQFEFAFPYVLQPADTPLDVWLYVVAAEEALAENVPEPTTGRLIAAPLAALGIWHRRRMRQ